MGSLGSPPSQVAPEGPAPAARNLPWLFAGRALRSFATAFLTVVFPLYLARSGYGSAAVGLTLSLAGVVTMGLVLAVGLAADRVGRRRLLLVLGLLTALGALLLAVAPLSLPLAVLASGLGGVGRGGGAGSGGAWGPVFPAEQPLLAEAAPRRNPTRAFGQMSFVGVMAGAAGSLVAGLPTLLHARGVGLLEGYHLLFGLGALLGLGMAAVTWPIREERSQPAAAAPATPPPLSVRQLIGRLTLTNGLNGFAIGFMGPMLTYWLYRRFGVDAAQIGLLYTVVNLVTALPYLGSARLAQRLGAVRKVVVTRLAAAAGLALMPFMPSFGWVAVLYTLRMGLNSLGMPARQSFTMSVADPRYRSRVAALGSLPSQVTSLVSPAVGGEVMQTWLDFPLVGAAAFMAANAVTYYLAFRGVAVPGEAGTALGPRAGALPAAGGEGGAPRGPAGA
jgi:MFS family permease